MRTSVTLCRTARHTRQGYLERVFGSILEPLGGILAAAAVERRRDGGKSEDAGGAKLIKRETQQLLIASRCAVSKVQRQVPSHPR